MKRLIVTISILLFSVLLISCSPVAYGNYDTESTEEIVIGSDERQSIIPRSGDNVALYFLIAVAGAAFAAAGAVIFVDIRRKEKDKK